MHDLPPPAHVQFVSNKFASIIKINPKPPNQTYGEFLCCIPNKFASIIKINPKPANQTYADLPCTEEDKVKIYELISTLSENGKLSLLFKQGRLKSIGAEIEYIHPLKFLGIIFSNSQLKLCMSNVFDDYFKRTGFMEGLAPSMMREYEKGKLLIYVPDFAKDINVPTAEIQPFFQSLDWEGLVAYLINRTDPA